MRNSIFYFTLFLLLGSGTLSCSSNKKRPISYCYWDTSFRLDTTLKQQYRASHFYVRYFDVDWDENTASARPIATLNVRDTISGKFTPTIYITNTVFEKSNASDLKTLAKHIAERIKSVNQNFAGNLQSALNVNWNDSARIEKIKTKIAKKYNNVLIDCDWTEGTKDKFFDFIRQMQTTIPDKEIQVTLRLWQYKYRDKAGIPPVKRCLLMCYNMQMANDYNANNSIATLAELKKYVRSKEYPVKLSVALPIFNWAVLFRNQQSVGIIGNTTTIDFDNDIENFKSISDNRYTLLNDRVIGTVLARKGDEIRVEKVSKSELSEMAHYLEQQLGKDDARTVTFFAWNKSYLENYKPDELEEIFSVLAP